MDKVMITMVSTIKSESKRRFLFRGLLFAVPGALVLLFFGIYSPLLFLKTWGWLIFLLGIGLISCGLVPYRMMSRYELRPITLTCEQGKVIFQGKEYVGDISYESNWIRYGMRVGRKFFPYFTESQSVRCRAYVLGQLGADLQAREEGSPASPLAFSE